MRTLIVIALVASTALFLGACGAQSEASQPVATAVQQAVTEDAGEVMDDEAVSSDGAESMTEAPMADEGAGGEAATPTAVEEESMAVEAPQAEATEAEATEAEAAAVTAERPAWQQIPLTDARTGETFTLAGFAGKTVFVEPFATWCSNCRQQLGNVQVVRGQVGDDVVFVTLSVEPNIGNDALVKYTDETGFDWAFAAMPPELLQALAGNFGQTIANPPATPHFIIRPDGSVTDLVTGIESPEALLSAIQAARGG